MVEALDSSEEAKRGLLHEVVALRKQSVFALILAVLFILITVYLYFQLQKSKKDLEKSNDGLKASKKQLEAKNIEIQSLNKELETFRQKLIKEESASSGVILPDRTFSYPRKYTDKQVASGQPCFGYLIYIQDRQGSQVSEALRQSLQEKGGIVPAIEHIAPSRAFRSSIRYFHKEDRDIATYLQRVALATFTSKEIAYSAEQLPISFIPNEKVPLGQLEVWLDR